MKIGILTFHNAHNYGAVLQCYSLQEYLKSCGHEVEIINYRLHAVDKLYHVYDRRIINVHAKNLPKRYFNVLRATRSMLITRRKNPSKYKKYRKFESFIKHKLNTGKCYYNYNDLLASNFNFDAIIAGSDQIWNPNLTGGINKAYFLDFVSKNTLKISYAASMGKTEITPPNKEYMQKFLRNFDVISVREKKLKSIVEDIINKDIYEVSDPTFLVNRNVFDNIEKAPNVKTKYIYVHNVHIKIVDERLIAIAEEISKQTNLPIIHNRKDYSFKNQAGTFFGGVEEFLGYVHNAEYVVTNSFHCTVFSILYERNFITIPHFTNPDRMLHLLEKLSLSNHAIDNVAKLPKNLDTLNINYKDVLNLKENMAQHSRDFLKNALSTKKDSTTKFSYLEFEDKFACYGCHACQSSCPNGAITMIESTEGFLYPRISSEKCTHCGKCKSVCIYKNDLLPSSQYESHVYLSRNISDKEVKKSSSGGVFSTLTKEILTNGGYVVGVGAKTPTNITYNIANTIDECQQFRDTKYVEPLRNNILKDTKQLLDAGKFVLFSGTPCQIAGLKSYLDKDYDNLYTIEVICSGVGSPKVYKKRIYEMEELYESKVIDYKFKEHFKGKNIPFSKITFENGAVDIERNANNTYMKLYKRHMLKRPSCSLCKFAGNTNSLADLTLGDFMGTLESLPFNSEFGVSIIKVNSLKGETLLNKCNKNLKLFETTYSIAYENNVTEPIPFAFNRCKFMADIRSEETTETVSTLANKYITTKRKRKRKS